MKYSFIKTSVIGHVTAAAVLPRIHRAKKRRKRDAAEEEGARTALVTTTANRAGIPMPRWKWTSVGAAHPAPAAAPLPQAAPALAAAAITTVAAALRQVKRSAVQLVLLKTNVCD